MAYPEYLREIFQSKKKGKKSRTIRHRIFCKTESWRPGLSENVVVFVAIIFLNRLMDTQSHRSLKFWVCPQNYAVSKKIHVATILRFRSNRWISMVPIGMGPRWFNDLTWNVILSTNLFFVTQQFCKKKSWDLTRLGFKKL